MTKWRLLRILHARPHLLSGASVGLASYFVLMAWHLPMLRVVMAWNIGSFTFLLLTAISFLQTQDNDISFDAKRQQEGE